MRVMVIVKANKDSEAGILPNEEILGKMGKYNEELVRAGVMLAGEGLQSSAKGKRVKFTGAERIVTDGPFAETTEQLGGYFLVEAANLDDAIAIAGRIPAASKGTVEIRPVVELSGMPQPNRPAQH